MMNDMLKCGMNDKRVYVLLQTAFLPRAGQASLFMSSRRTHRLIRSHRRAVVVK